MTTPSGPEGTLTALAIVAITFVAGMVMGVVLSLVVVWMMVRG